MLRTHTELLLLRVSLSCSEGDTLLYQGPGGPQAQTPLPGLRLVLPCPLPPRLTQGHGAQGNTCDAEATQEAQGHVHGQGGAEGGT